MGRAGRVSSGRSRIMCCSTSAAGPSWLSRGREHPVLVADSFCAFDVVSCAESTRAAVTLAELFITAAPVLGLLLVVAWQARERGASKSSRSAIVAAVNALEQEREHELAF